MVTLPVFITDSTKTQLQVVARSPIENFQPHGGDSVFSNERIPGKKEILSTYMLNLLLLGLIYSKNLPKNVTTKQL